MSHNSLDRITPGFRRILGNTGWLMFDRIVRMGLGVIVGVLVARYLGPAQFGILSFALSFVALFGTITTLGLEGIAARDIVRHESAASEILGTAFILRISVAFFLPWIVIGLLRWIQPHDSTTLALVSLLTVGMIFQAFDTIDSYFQARLRSRLTVWAKNSAFLVMAGVRLWLIHQRAPLWTFAAAQVAELALGAVGLVVAYRWTGGHLLLWRAQKDRAMKLIRQSWPVMLTGMAIMIYMRIDMVMLKVMQGDRAVGIYATATRISEMWYFIPVAIVSSVSPAIIRARDDPKLYYDRLGKLFSLLAFMALTGGATIALCSPWIIHLLYSDAFSAAAPVLAVHVWASIFVFLGIAQDPWNISENLLKLAFYRTLAGAVTNILLNLVLIPHYSAMGAAVATVASYGIAGVFSNAFDTRTRPIFLLQVKALLPHKLWDLLTG